MKIHLAILLLLILAFSCSKNDFEDTKLYIEFDKETYQSNDNFELTVRIVPIEAEKTIRLYKNLNNFEISFLSKAEHLGLTQELKKHFIEGPSLTGDDSEYVDNYTISKENPFKKTFLGTITETEKEIVIDIPELKIKNKIDKKYLRNNPSILIMGNCRTVYGIEGNPFESTEIKIKVE